MLQSMTGFGKSAVELKHARYTIDVKSVNSKNADVNVRLPYDMRGYELEIRKLVASGLQRGKIDVYINAQVSGEEGDLALNIPLIQNYMTQIEAVSPEISLEKRFEAAMRLPNITSEDTIEWGDSEWQKFKVALQEAVYKVTEFRMDEGKSMEDEFKLRVSNIVALLKKVPQYEDERIATIRERMIKSLEEIKEVDRDRLEQELIFYTEKLDVTEEKVRLQKHCEYFIETMNLPESNGKKLNFITQEMGREINTLGSKSNHAELQKIVVEMKDELEKIKEQILNIL
ncbi:YicC family protein [Flavobacteriaceae bacterium Ap0902]|nr:YicC family protein [Flavobacteriaceae bacterium Ap0902]